MKKADILPLVLEACISKKNLGFGLRAKLTLVIIICVTWAVMLACLRLSFHIDRKERIYHKVNIG